MAERTSIEWADATWNPWIGCRQLQPGCAYCYMFSAMHRFGKDPEIVQRTQPATFNAPLKWAEPKLIFTCSWSDFFHEEADAWRPDAWRIISETPQHFYLILTKRIARAIRHLPALWPLPNVMLGISVDYQRSLDRNIGTLEHFHVAGKFLSIEPLLGPIDLPIPPGARFPQPRPPDWPRWDEQRRTQWIVDISRQTYIARLAIPFDWVIVGGESGPKARPCNLDHVHSIVEQCTATDVPVFVKQLGSHWAKQNNSATTKGQDPNEWPVSLAVQDFPAQIRRWRQCHGREENA